MTTVWVEDRDQELAGHIGPLMTFHFKEEKKAGKGENPSPNVEGVDSVQLLILVHFFG